MGSVEWGSGLLNGRDPAKGLSRNRIIQWVSKGGPQVLWSTQAHVDNRLEPMFAPLKGKQHRHF